MARMSWWGALALGVCLVGGAAAAQTQAPDDGRVIMDAPPVRIDRRDFPPNAPITNVGPDGRIIPSGSRRPAPGDIVRPVPVITLNGVRITASDTEALARFYEKAFGMVEVQRIAFGPGNPEIMLNFGMTVEEGQANPNGDIVVYPRAEDEPEDTVAHVIFNVSDAETVVADVKAYGGNVVREPFTFGDTGIVIAFVADPDGNQIELIQQPG